MRRRWLVSLALLAIGPAIARGDNGNQSADPQADSSKASKFHDRSSTNGLDRAVHVALRQEATASRAETHEAAIRELAQLYRRLSSDSKSYEPQHAQLRALVRRRLAANTRRLQRELESSQSDSKPRRGEPGAAARLPDKERTILAQQAPPQAGVPPAGAGSTAQELIDLITNTIAPDTWDTNGGLGTIRYFSLGNLLVVRQTAEVHGQLADTIGQLRGN